MSTIEQGKTDTGLDVQVTLPTSGNPIDGTIARMVEGPFQEDPNLGKRVSVEGEETYIEVPPQEDWFEIRTIRGRDVVYLKFRCTGLEIIYYGPYETKEDALFALSNIIASIEERLVNG